MEWDEIQNEFDRAYGMSCKPSGLQKYKAGHIFDENMSVKWNRDKLEEENKKFEDEVSRLNTAKNKWRPYLPRSDSTELPPVHKRMSESEET